MPNIKLLVALLSFVPTISIAGSIYKDPSETDLCKKILTSAVDKQQVIQSIVCLRNDPFSDINQVKEIISQAKILTKNLNIQTEDEDIKKEINLLLEQKSKRIYLRITGNTGLTGLLAVNKGLYGNKSYPLVDFEALPFSFIYESSIWGTDKAIPLKSVKSFIYTQHGNIDIGTIITKTNDGETKIDDSYQANYPILVYGESTSQWSAIQSFVGTGYFYDRIVENYNLPLKPALVSNINVEFLTESQAKKEIELVVSRKLEKDNEAKKQQQVAINNAKKQSELKNQNLAKMAKEKIGTEDSCKRTDLGRMGSRYDPESVEVSCQFGGLVELRELPSSGWIIVQKFKDNTGVVTDYIIRKAR